MNTLPKLLIAVLFLFFLSSCAEETSSCEGNESIRWYVDGKTHALEFDDVHCYFADDRMLYISARPSINVLETGLRIQYDLIGQTAEFIAHAFDNDDEYIFSRGSSLEMTVSTFSAEGDLICIEFDNGEFSGEFIVMLDGVVESASVKGTVWLDENQNGIMESSESRLSNVGLSLKTEFENLQDGNQDQNPNYYPTFSVKTDANGEFTFSGVFIDHPMRVSYFTLSDPTLSEADLGTNDTVDSDFYLARELTDRKWYHTDVFVVEEAGLKDDIGLGIIEE